MLAVVAAMVLAGCASPSFSYRDYERKAAHTADEAASVVQSAVLTVRAATGSKAPRPYLDVLFTESESTLGDIQSTFEGIQPPARSVRRAPDRGRRPAHRGRRGALRSADRGPPRSSRRAGHDRGAARRGAREAGRVRGGAPVKRLFAVALGILTAIGGFVDIGDLVTNALVGSRFGLSLAWVIVGRRRRHLPVRRDVRPGRRGDRPRHLRPGPRAARPAGGAGQPGRVVPGHVADLHRRDRRRRAGPRAGHQRELPAVGAAGRRSRCGWCIWRVQVLRAGERLRPAGAGPGRVRGRAVAARPGLGQLWHDARSPSRTSPARRGCRPTSTTRSRCSARR